MKANLSIGNVCNTKSNYLYVLLEERKFVEKENNNLENPYYIY